ncbi:MAG: methyltransferase domain-containing protein [Cyanobacteria bacterium J06632_3]
MLLSTPTVSTNTQKATFVQFGCGLSAPDAWTNFDASPTLRLQKLPLIGNLIPSGPYGRFPSNVRYGDILKGLPINPGSVDYLYCSHVLEHLTIEEVRLALKNCYSHLKPGGVFRMVLPDIEIMAREYLASTSSSAVHDFMYLTWLGEHNGRLGAVGNFKQWMSRSRHLWMWDYKALAYELEQIGFQNIRRARIGDSQIEAFNEIEDPERWTHELGIQCEREQS